MKKIVRLTESELIKLVERVISEQDDILSKKGYVLGEINKLKGPKFDELKKKYSTYKYYTKGEVSLISDGNQVIFIVAPQKVTDLGLGLGPHNINNILKYL